MADSDDDYEFGGSRKRHNKFRNERDDFNDYGGGSASSDSRFGNGNTQLSSMIVSPTATAGGYNKRRESREPSIGSGDAPGRGDYGRSRPYDSDQSK